MRNVWRLRNVTFVALLVVAALLLLVARGANEAEAAPFSPTLSATLVSSAAGAVSDVITVDDWGNVPAPSHDFPNSFSNFTPAGWGMPAADTPLIPIGIRTGTALVVTTLGVLNSACAIPVPISFSGGSQPPLALPTTALLDASTDGTGADTIAPGAGFAALIADVAPADGIMDGAQHWNTLLTALLGPLPPGQPIERQVATTNLFGTTIWVDIPTFSPGFIAPAKLGFVQLNIVQNFSPFLPPIPGLLTDACGLRATINQQGLASAPSFSGHRTNPAPNLATGGTEIFFMRSTSDRNADTDGLANRRDTCPFMPNTGLDTNVNGIDDICDTSGPGSDVDGDFVLNRADNCPQVANGLLQVAIPGVGNQDDLLEIAAGPPVDGGPANDSIGDACDPNPAVSDGHFHTVLNLAPVCVTFGGAFGGDPDGDGYCSATEVGALSDPGNPASTPEALSIPTTCSDGADNDGILGTDLADAKCQLPDHDLAIRKITGDSVINGGSECVDVGVNPTTTGCGENIIIRNNTGQEEFGQVGIIVDPIFGAGCSGPVVVLHGGSAVSHPPVPVSSGPINTDGDTDIEWLLVVDVTIPANSQRTVNVGVIFPACGPNVGTPADYIKIVDLCHDDDIAPLGLFGLQGCGNPDPDGGQDRVNLANDAPVIKVLNDLTR